MCYTWHMSRQPLDLGAYDVVVVGSGSAGATAAVAAARNGASTLLLEKLPFLGGVSTAVLDTFYGFYTPGTRARKVVGGLAERLGDDLAAYTEVKDPVCDLIVAAAEDWASAGRPHDD